MDMEARKKAGPFLPKWSKVKGRHKALSSGSLFKPDISAAINRYDQSLKDYEDLLDQQDKIKDLVRQRLSENKDNAAEISKLTEQIVQITKKAGDSIFKDYDTLGKSLAARDDDPDKIVAALDDVVSTADDFVDSRNDLWKQIDGLAHNNVNLWKKTRDEFKTKAASMKSDMKKLEDGAQKAEDDITGTLDDYKKIADDADHPEIIKDLDSLKVC